MKKTHRKDVSRLYQSQEVRELHAGISDLAGIECEKEGNRPNPASFRDEGGLGAVVEEGKKEDEVGD